MQHMEIRHYVTRDGKDVFQTWLEQLRDITLRARVELRIARLERGLFGDCKTIRAGVFELRIDTGPGFRIYFGREGERIVILLCGGDKRTQQKDIEHAIGYWKDYQARDD
jgi:putative addiction module killer protein